MESANVRPARSEERRWIDSSWGVPAAMGAVWILFVLVPDLVTYFLDPTGQMTLKMRVVYAVTMGASCAIWIAIGVALARLRARRPTLGLVAVIAFALVMAVCAGGTLLYRVYFDYNPKPVIFSFYLANFAYVTSLLATSTSALFKINVVVLPLLLLAALLLVTRGDVRAVSVTRRMKGALGVAIAIQLFCWAFPTKVSSSSPDLIGVKTAVLGGALWAKGTALPMLPRPERIKVAPTPARRAPNVLLLVNESVGRKQVAPWNDSAPKSELSEFLAKHAEHSVWFPRATTVAPVTNVAFPALLSGLSPEAPQGSFRRAPLVWHDAQAAGYATALFSAEDYKYSFFRGFFGSKDQPGTFKTAAELADARTVDSGVDDALPAAEALAFIHKSPVDHPFFIVVQFNGSHFPCWNPEHPNEAVAAFDDASRRKRCDASIAYIDRQVGKILQSLETEHRLEQTLVITTSDHGESFDPAKPKRPINFYEDTMGVPLAVHVPPAMEGAEEVVRALVANRERRVSNLDIVPTLLDLWGRDPRKADVEADRPALSGQSLLAPVPVDRVLVSTARGSIYEPPVQGFAFYHGNDKWLFDEKRGLQFFDLESDVAEERNLVKQNAVPSSERSFFEANIHQHPMLELALQSSENSREPAQ